MNLQSLTASIESGNGAGAVSIVQDALEGGTDPQIILDAMTTAMANVGSAFQRGETYVPEMLISARAMKQAMGLLEPRLIVAGVRPEAIAVIGTVQGDLHDIGKNLVGMMLKGANVEVIDLGTNVPAERFAAAAVEHGASLVGMSALLTTTMVAMQDAVAAVRRALPTQVKVMVGGAPVTQEFADRIGADGYAPDAATAVDVAKRLMAATV